MKFNNAKELLEYYNQGHEEGYEEGYEEGLYNNNLD
jgi:flagellar biosynthesis/type III secretory pathway protein FliH